MHYALIVTLLLIFILGLGQLARKISVPYPILFVIGGLFIGFIPDLPRISLDPEFVFFIFLPPLLYAQAVQTSWRDVRFHFRAILLLAIGLVVATTVVVAYVAHWLIPDFPLSAGFVLGAIVSPPDAVAASTIARRLGLPRRIVTILEGESLVNDATSLVIFKVALAALATTVNAEPWFGRVWYPAEFTYVAAGGVAVGWIIGWIAHRLKQLGMHDDPQIVMTISLATPFLSYLAADSMGASGVLAVVTTGLYVGWTSPEDTPSRIRLQSHAFWDTIEYILNGIIFVLIGLQLPFIIQSMQEPWWPRPFIYALVINAICIAVRFLWCFGGAYLPWFLSGRVRRTEGYPDWREVFVGSWSGIRGVVSLATALVLNGYSHFPRSHLMQFLAFSVILTSLVLQGLSLPFIIRWLKLTDDGTVEREERAARKRLAQTVTEKITEARGSDSIPSAAVEWVERLYDERDSFLAAEEDAADSGAKAKHATRASLRKFRLSLITAQRRALLDMRRKREIGDDVVHKIEHELDLDEEHLRA